MVVILVILILAGFYMWMKQTNQVAEAPIVETTTETDSQVNEINSQSAGDDTSSIEADLNATDVDSIDAELNAS
jgi:hypothetical protein